jgi:hypothetical protein
MGLVLEPKSIGSNQRIELKGENNMKNQICNLGSKARSHSRVYFALNGSKLIVAKLDP